MTKQTPEEILVSNLRQVGFMTSDKSEYGVILVSRYDIKGGITPDGVFLDHRKCFDKFSKCAIRLPLPKNSRQLKALLSEIEYLGTKEGYRRSNIYDYEVTEY